MGITFVRWLMTINLGLAALQPLSAGLLMSGHGPASIHVRLAFALVIGALIQAVSAAVLWWRNRVPARIARLSIVLFVMVLIQIWAGRNREYWLHVPIGVGLVGLQMRLVNGLGTKEPPGRYTPGE
jgi:hypothetical protein